jgi:O-antigen/teichoic acid export membrane protein
MVYLAGSALVGLGNFLLLPLYTRCLSADAFGVYALLDVSILVAVTIGQLGIGVSYLKWFADLPQSRHPQLLTSAAAMSVAAGALGGVTLMAVAACTRWAAAAGPLLPWLLLVLVPIETLQAILLSDLRAHRRSVLFCCAAAARLFIMAAASIWFVQVRHQGLAGIFLGRAIGGAAGIVLLGAICLPSPLGRASPGLMWGLLRYGLPLVWAALLGVAMDAAGRYFLARESGLAQVALYTVALKISAVMSVCFLQPFGTAWSSVMFRIARDEGASAVITRILGYTFVAAMALAAAISILSPVVLPLFGNALYRRAGILVPWLLLPAAFRILEYWSSFGLYVSRRTSWIAGCSSGGAVLNLAALLLLVPRYGAFGVALAWTAGLLLSICGYAWRGQRYFRLPTNLRALAAGLALWAAGAVAAAASPGGFTTRAIGFSVAAAIAVAIPLILLGRRGFPALQGHQV